MATLMSGCGQNPETVKYSKKELLKQTRCRQSSVDYIIQTMEKMTYFDKDKINGFYEDCSLTEKERALKCLKNYKPSNEEAHKYLKNKFIDEYNFLNMNDYDENKL